MKSKSVPERVEEYLKSIQLTDIAQRAEAHSLNHYEDFISYSPDGYMCDGLYLEGYDNVEYGIEIELFVMCGNLLSETELGTESTYNLIVNRTSELFEEWERINN
ncbi:hypothetical protein N8986_02115 [Flavobacteriaceae bacterium]|nr:hypothetical protein [Flavobacteriaceae bacterium]